MNYRQEMMERIKRDVPQGLSYCNKNYKLNRAVNDFLLFGDDYLYNEAPSWIYDRIHSYLEKRQFKKYFIEQLEWRWNPEDKKEALKIYHKFMNSGLTKIDEYGFLSSGGIVYLNYWKQENNECSSMKGKKGVALKDWKFAWHKKSDWNKKSDWHKHDPFSLTFRQGIKWIIDDFFNERVEH